MPFLRRHEEKFLLALRHTCSYNEITSQRLVKKMKELVEKLALTQDLSDEELLCLIGDESPDTQALLAEKADAIRRQWYGNDVYVRGLIEFTNYCKNNCYYCGIRRGNTKADRYRLTEEEILTCCRQGWALGYRTFVLQGGEDPYFTDQRLCDLIRHIKAEFPSCAVTLSVGEKSWESYAAYREAGADRYLLRHESANPTHYGKLHPAEMSLANRKQCLFDLKELGYQVGAGFMVGAPYQTPEHLLEDLRFLQQLQPDMIGIGPYLTHRDTPFREMPCGGLALTLRLLSMVRLMFPSVLLPATTALGTLHPSGRELGMKAGANVVMPNLSPAAAREKYTLYENKLSADSEAAEARRELERRMEQVGYRIVTHRGDRKSAKHC